MNKEISSDDINVLQFRDELIQLLKKYKCEISGACQGDGHMSLEFYNDKSNLYSYYEMEDVYSNYSLYKENDDYNLECVMDNIINNSFNRDSSKMAGLNNIKVYCGVITNDFGKASLKFQELKNKYTDEEVEIFRISKDYMELRLSNGERYIWIKANTSSKGYRCGKIIIDRNITLEELYEIIMPICYACGKEDVEIF